MASDQAVWNALRDVHKVLKKWERINKRLPRKIREDATSQLLSDLNDAQESIDETVREALDTEIRADAHPVFDTTDLTRRIQKFASLLIEANRIDLAKDLLTASNQLKANEPSERRAEERDEDPMTISETQVLVLKKLVAMGEEDTARTLAKRLATQEQPDEPVETRAKTDDILAEAEDQMTPQQMIAAAMAERDAAGDEEVATPEPPADDLDVDALVAEALEADDDIPDVGERRAAQEERLSGTEKRAQGINRLVEIVEGDVLKRRFNHQVQKWTDDEFTPEKAAEMQQELVAVCTDVINKYMGCVIMPITDEQVAILGQLVELGEHEAAKALADGLAKKALEAAPDETLEETPAEEHTAGAEDIATLISTGKIDGAIKALRAS